MRLKPYTKVRLTFLGHEVWRGDWWTFHNANRLHPEMPAVKKALNKGKGGFFTLMTGSVVERTD
jgi:hypothetical protein